MDTKWTDKTHAKENRISHQDNSDMIQKYEMLHDDVEKTQSSDQSIKDHTVLPQIQTY